MTSIITISGGYFLTFILLELSGVFDPIGHSLLKILKFHETYFPSPPSCFLNIDILLN